FHERLSACVSSQSHYLHSKVHAEARIRTGTTVPCCPRYESGCPPDMTAFGNRHADAKRPQPQGCGLPVVDHDRRIGSSVWSNLVPRPASFPQKTKASPSLSRRQAREPEPPALTASARELPSPSS